MIFIAHDRHLSDPLLASRNLRIDLGDELEHQAIEGVRILEHQQMVGAGNHVMARIRPEPMRFLRALR